MSTSGPPLAPQWSAPILWIFGTLVVHVGFPYGISLLTARNGWIQGFPSLWNLIGLPLVAAGLGMIYWGASLHFVSTSHGWRMETTPNYLLTKAPYSFTRNPLYLLEIIMWFGWTIFYGSLAVFITTILWWIIFAFIIIPYEERQLEARFGEEYLKYKRAVPRWIMLRPVTAQ